MLAQIWANGTYHVVLGTRARSTRRWDHSRWFKGCLVSFKNSFRALATSRDTCVSGQHKGVSYHESRVGIQSTQGDRDGTDSASHSVTSRHPLHVCTIQGAECGWAEASHPPTQEVTPHSSALFSTRPIKL